MPRNKKAERIQSIHVIFTVSRLDDQGNTLPELTEIATHANKESHQIRSNIQEVNDQKEKTQNSDSAIQNIPQKKIPDFDFNPPSVINAQQIINFEKEREVQEEQDQLHIPAGLFLNWEENLENREDFIAALTKAVGKWSVSCQEIAIEKIGLHDWKCLIRFCNKIDKIIEHSDTLGFKFDEVTYYANPTKDYPYGKCHGDKLFNSFKSDNQSAVWWKFRRGLQKWEVVQFKEGSLVSQFFSAKTKKEEFEIIAKNGKLMDLANFNRLSSNKNLLATQMQVEDSEQWSGYKIPDFFHERNKDLKARKRRIDELEEKINFDLQFRRHNQTENCENYLRRFMEAASIQRKLNLFDLDDVAEIMSEAPTCCQNYHNMTREQYGIKTELKLMEYFNLVLNYAGGRFWGLILGGYRGTGKTLLIKEFIAGLKSLYKEGKLHSQNTIKELKAHLKSLQSKKSRHERRIDRSKLEADIKEFGIELQRAEDKLINYENYWERTKFRDEFHLYFQEQLEQSEFESKRYTSKGMVLDDVKYDPKHQNMYKGFLAATGGAGNGKFVNAKFEPNQIGVFITNDYLDLQFFKESYIFKRDVVIIEVCHYLGPEELNPRIFGRRIINQTFDDRSIIDFGRKVQCSYFNNKAKSQQKDYTVSSSKTTTHKDFISDSTSPLLSSSMKPQIQRSSTLIASSEDVIDNSRKAEQKVRRSKTVTSIDVFKDVIDADLFNIIQDERIVQNNNDEDKLNQIESDNYNESSARPEHQREKKPDIYEDQELSFSYSSHIEEEHGENSMHIEDEGENNVGGSILEFITRKVDAVHNELEQEEEIRRKKVTPSNVITKEDRRKDKELQHRIRLKDQNQDYFQNINFLDNEAQEGNGSEHEEDEEKTPKVNKSIKKISVGALRLTLNSHTKRKLYVKNKENEAPENVFVIDSDSIHEKKVCDESSRSSLHNLSALY